MMPRLAVLPFLLLCAFSQADAQIAAEEILELEQTLRSPWGKPLTRAWPVGTTLQLTAHELKGKPPINCPQARFVFLRTAAAGLFEGNLPAPAEQSARVMGLPDRIVTQRVSCANGGFDIHRAVDGRAWIALDNTVLVWKRSRIASSPEASVQSLLLEHFANDFAFGREAVNARAQLLTTDLVKQLNDWSTRTKNSKEPPELNGDPFTDSQEGPTSFELAAALFDGSTARVPVTFRSEGNSVRTVHVMLTQIAQKWRVSDLEYEDGTRLSELLSR